MSTPICDFINKYSKENFSRFHMPGHKGVNFHGMERLDITEIKGADYLFEPDGIIDQSENQMSDVFGTAKTLYSTEGSSLCIKTMLGIVNQMRKDKSRKMLAVAPRNVHKAFINACILLDIEVFWVYPSKQSFSICASEIVPEDIQNALADCPHKPDCVYVTSPDYQGNICDIESIAKICHSMNIPLLCDNAHGAYLNFLDENIHPMALGADMCCDSAHKTLPCYTGGALLHISKSAPEEFLKCAKNIMSMFASTSPSYLIMQSLDMCGDYLGKSYKKELFETVKRVEICKERITSYGWTLYGNEPCKITICANDSGFEGNELGNRLREYHIEPEYTDFKYVVLMITPFNSEEDLLRVEKAFSEIPQPRIRICFEECEIPRAVVRTGIRQAALSDFKTVPVDDAEGKICAMTVTCCQPSVPVVISGEEITADVIKIMKRYSIYEINVL